MSYEVKFRNVSEFSVHVIENATRLRETQFGRNTISARLQTFQSRRALVLPTNSTQRLILESYREMYATFVVTLQLYNIYYSSGKPVEGIKIKFDHNGLTVYGWSTCKEFLKLFGAQIQNLKICYGDFGLEKFDSLHDSIFNSCISRGNLTQIEFNSPQMFPIYEPFETNYNEIKNVYLNFEYEHM